MRKLLLSLFVVSFAGFCFAPIELTQKPVNGYKPPAATEQDLQRQQGNQKTLGQVGIVPDHEGGAAQIDPNSDGSGKDVLGQAQKHMDNNGSSDDPQAKQVLAAAAEEQANKAKGWTPMLFVGGLFLCLGFGAVFGLRQWAAKHVPHVEEAKKVDW